MARFYSGTPSDRVSQELCPSYSDTGTWAYDRGSTTRLKHRCFSCDTIVWMRLLSTSLLSDLRVLASAVRSAGDLPAFLARDAGAKRSEVLAAQPSRASV